MTDRPDCRLVRAGETYAGKQGFNYVTGISAESAGARGLCMMLLTIRPGSAPGRICIPITRPRSTW